MDPVNKIDTETKRFGFWTDLIIRERDVDVKTSWIYPVAQIRVTLRTTSLELYNAPV